MELPLSHPEVNPNIPALVKTEVKIEAEDTRPVQLPSSTPLLNTPKPQPTPAFDKKFFDMFPSSLLPNQKSEPKLTHFPLVIHDPFTIKAFAHFQAAFNDFLKGSIFGPIFQTVPPLKKPETKQPVASTIKVKDECIVKKEEGVQEITVNNAEAEKTNVPPKKVPKKKAQNRIKNIPGLIMQRVRSSVKAYFARNPKVVYKDKRLAYVEKILDPIPRQDKEKLVTFLETYQKNWKTWHTIQLYLQSNERSGEIMLDVVLEFFKEDGLEDFNDWMNGGKMSEKSKAAVNELKDRIGTKFSRLLLKTDLGEDDEELLKSKEKLVKKEENPGN